MATAGDLISAAFTKISIATPTTAQNASALVTLNDLISILGADLIPPYITSYSHSLTIGDYDYTIGSGGNFDTVRPLKIEGCYLKDSSGYDRVISILSKKDYNRMYNKDATAPPSGLYYSPEYPLGKILFDSAPEQAYDAYFDLWVNFTEFATSATTVTLPDEYKAFLIYNLAVSLAEDWGRDVSKTLYAMTQESKRIIESLNASNKPVPLARFDTRRIDDGSSWNIVGDDYIDGGVF